MQELGSFEISGQIICCDSTQISNVKNGKYLAQMNVVKQTCVGLFKKNKNFITSEANYTEGIGLFKLKYRLIYI